MPQQNTFAVQDGGVDTCGHVLPAAPFGLHQISGTHERVAMAVGFHYVVEHGPAPG